MTGRRSHDDAQSFEEAWAGRPPRDEQIAELVRFAERLCASATVEPAPQFRGSLRTQLMSEAKTVLVSSPDPTPSPAPRSRRHSVRRRLAALTAAAVASVGVVGLVSSSASAVPGEMLYPVKRGVESVQLALHRDDASRGSFQLAQAAERLAEARELSTKNGREDLIADSLQDFAKQAHSGSTSLFSDFSAHGQETSIRTVNDFAAAATVDLSALSAEVPTGASASFEAATQAVSDLATQASSLCVRCTTENVRRLVGAVTELARNNAGTKSSKADKSLAEAGQTGQAQTTTGHAPTQPDTTASTPDLPTVVTVPAPSPSNPTPSLGDVTGPLLGALLGDDDQVGLVPGLLNGLLGANK